MTSFPARLIAALALTAFLAVGVAACGDDDDGGSGGSGVSGSVRIDGSSTVGPLSSAVAERANRCPPRGAATCVSASYHASWTRAEGRAARAESGRLPA